MRQGMHITVVPKATSATLCQGEPRFGPACNRLDVTCARTELDWHPQVDMYEGFVRTSEFIAGALTTSKWVRTASGMVGA